VLALGDLAYDSGTRAEFQECYDPSWGQFTDRVHPVPGNHEYGTDAAAPYFEYFGSAAGEPAKGWYSLELGEWHILALNSNCDEVGCDAGSEQEQWLRAELESSDARCTLAFWHHPRFASGEEHGGTRAVEDLWQALLDHRVELLLSGHEHLYERTAPLDAEGDVDPENGVRQFVVGTGGGNFYDFAGRIAGSEAAIADTAGVLGVTLRADGYDWEFLPVHPDAPSDGGSAECR
jgi:acid phosphatase type 7